VFHCGPKGADGRASPGAKGMHAFTQGAKQAVHFSSALCSCVPDTEQDPLLARECSLPAQPPATVKAHGHHSSISAHQSAQPLPSTAGWRTNTLQAA